jgi:5-methylcytosine-specific restriction endonuclease McrA
MGSASAPEPELVPELAELEGLRAQHAALYPDRPPPTKLVVEAPAAPLPTDAATREPIPEAVRAHVWRRDEGRCCRCDSATQLEFDHIIPLALGGSSTANNLQLLCRGCNRSKGARIA